MDSQETYRGVKDILTAIYTADRRMEELMPTAKNWTDAPGAQYGRVQFFLMELHLAIEGEGGLIDALEDMFDERRPSYFDRKQPTGEGEPTQDA